MLLGREREQQLVQRLLDDARAGRAGTLCIVGDAGVGKSALLEHAATAAAAADMTVLRARGVQSEAHIPFAGLLELVRPVLAHLPRMAEPQRAALESALALRPGSAHDRFAIGAATLSLLAAASDEAPLVAVVDDAQWLDGSSAAALLFACRRLVADHAAVFVALRSGEPSAFDATSLSNVVLEGLDREATAALLASRATDPVPPEVVDRLHEGTRGNPLALIELADRVSEIRPTPLDTPLPTSARVSAVYVDRYESLPDDARDAVLLAAVDGTGDLTMLAKAAVHLGVDISALGAAESAGLVVVTDDHVEFRHPLVRSAIYGNAPSNRRRSMHAAIAAVMPDVDADRRAWHLALAALGPDERASAALVGAGKRARARSAYDVASHAFERAAGLTIDDEQRSALLFEAADAAWLGGLATRTNTLLDAARRIACRPEVAVAVDHLRGHVATRLGPVRVGQLLLLEGAERAAAVDPDRAVVMLAEAVSAGFYGGDVDTMERAAAGIQPLMTSAISRRAVFLGTMARGMAMIFAGKGDRGGASLLREAVGLLAESDELSGDPRLLAWAAMGPVWLRESGGGDLIERAVGLAREQAAVGVLPFLLSHVAIEDAASDQWARADAGFHEAIDLARESGQRTDLAVALSRLAWLEARQGRASECRAHAAEARELSTELGVGPTEIWTLAALGDLEFGAGDFEAARARYEEQASLLHERHVGDADLSPAPELVDVLIRLGKLEAARDQVPAFERDAIAKGQPWALARAARCRGLLADDDDIDGHFTDALALHDKTPDVFETAKTRLAYGARLRRTRQRVRAREQLRAALAVFDQLEADPWSRMVRTELAASGETARARNESTRDQLTPQERQIALLLGNGQTTREAAAALFLSPKTIEYHLRSVYRKLGISSRGELAAELETTRPPSSVADTGVKRGGHTAGR